jgi:hypothetical protein
MSTRIFVSHSAKDSEAGKALVDLLSRAFPQLEDQILYTSMPSSGLPSGAKISETLQKGLNESEMVIGIISGNSLNSDWVLFELGAAWGMEKLVIPLLCNIEHEDLPSPLRDRNAVKAHNRDDILQMLETIRDGLKLNQRSDTRYNRNVDELLHVVSEMTKYEKAVGEAISTADEFARRLDQFDQLINTLPKLRQEADNKLPETDRETIGLWIWGILRFESGRELIARSLREIVYSGDRDYDEYLWPEFQRALYEQSRHLSALELDFEASGRQLVGKVSLDVISHIHQLLFIKKDLMERMLKIERPHSPEEFEKLGKFSVRLHYVQRQAHEVSRTLESYLGPGRVRRGGQ